MIHISKPVVAKFIEKHINSPVADQIANLIVSNINGGVLNGLMNMFLTDQKITAFEPGDFFRMKAPYGHKNKHFYEDELMDLGLYEDGYIFGEIDKSNDWNSEHDPYCASMKCYLFYGKDAKYQDSFSIFELEKIEKEQIPHFNGSYIRRIIDQSHQGISDSETDSNS